MRKLLFLVRMRDKLPKMMNECRFLAAAKQSIEKSTFHALPWSIEKIGWIPKVDDCCLINSVEKYFCFQLTCITYFLVASIIAYYFTIDAVKHFAREHYNFVQPSRL